MPGVQTLQREASVRPRARVSRPWRTEWSWWLAATAVYLVSRIPAIAGFLAARTAEGHPPSLLEAQRRWDGWWYLYIAEFGYPGELNLPGRPSYGPWGFFPAWPMVIRFTARVLDLDYVIAGIVAASVFGVALALVLRRFAAHFVGDRKALVVVALFFFWPGAVVLSLPYTEAAFLFFAVAALDALVRERWLVASLATFGACCIRSTGIALFAAFGLQLLLLTRRWWVSRVGTGLERGTALPWRAALPLVAGAAGIALTFGYAYVRTGRALIWFDAQEQWNQVLDFGVPLYGGFATAVAGPTPDRPHLLVMLASLTLFVALSAAGRRFWRVLPWPVIAYAVVLLALALLYSNVGPRPRMLLPVVPFFVVAALVLTAWRARLVVPVALVGFAGLSGLYAFAVMYQALHVVA